jgi:hypothetical protein
LPTPGRDLDRWSDRLTFPRQSTGSILKSILPQQLPFTYL